MRALLLCVLVGGVVGAGFWQCNPNSIGRPCVNPQGSDVRGTQISSPALECPSRLCLITKENANHTETDGGAVAVCTAECSNDGDCDAESKASCKSGFACAMVTTSGDFCCRKLCVCKEDLDPELNQDPLDGGVIIPHACDPNTYRASGQAPTCANIKL